MKSIFFPPPIWPRWKGLQQRNRWSSFLHGLLIISFIIALLPGAVAQAAPTMSPPVALLAQAADPCAAAPLQDNSKLFLPGIHGNEDGLSASVQQTALAEPEAVTRSLQYQSGMTYRYRWEYELISVSNSRGTEGIRSGDATTTTLNGKVEIAITAKLDNGSYQGQMVLLDPRFCTIASNGAPARIDNADVATELARPLRFVQQPDGVITNIEYPADAAADTLNIQKGILTSLQIKLQTTNTYSASESGVQGLYNAHYQADEIGQQLQITKTVSQDDYTNLISKGAPTVALQLQETAHATLDGATSVFAEIRYSQNVQSTDEGQAPLDPSTGQDGLAIWSDIKSRGSLILEKVLTTPASTSQIPLAAYVSGDLGGALVHDDTLESYLDISQVNLDAELDKLEANPTDLAQMSYLLDLATLDEAGTIVSKIAQRLAGKSSEVLSTYIGILGEIRTPAAQEVLTTMLPTGAQIASLAATLTITDQESALYAIVLLESPTITTVETLQTLAGENSALQEQGILALGAAASYLSGDGRTPAEQALAQEIQDGFVANLNTVTAASIASTDVLTDDIEEAQELYLMALGNVGTESALGTIDDFVEDDSTVVRSAALDALRKIPGDEAEALLLGVLSDDSEADETRDLAAAILSGRDTLSDSSEQALSDYASGADNLATGGLYSRTWNKNLGGKYAGVNMPGGLTVASPPKYYPYLYGYQKLEGYLWNFRYRFATAEVLSSRVGNKQRVGIYLSLLNNRIKKQFQRDVACDYERKGNLFDQRMSLYSLSYTIIVYVVPVRLKVEAIGTLGLDYGYKQNLCNNTRPSIVGTITPYGDVTVSGSATVEGALARAGAQVDARLLNTAMTARGTLAYNANTNKLSYCVEVRVNTKPLAINLFVYYDELHSKVEWRGFRTRVKTWWSRKYERTLWNYETPSRSYWMLDKCY